MSSLRIEWHSAKALSNLAKHGVSFEEAGTVFFDEQALLIHDPDHSGSEERFLILGLSAEVRLLVVCHCERENGDLVRIISARKANRTERGIYLKRAKP